MAGRRRRGWPPQLRPPRRRTPRSPGGSTRRPRAARRAPRRAQPLSRGARERAHDVAARLERRQEALAGEEQRLTAQLAALAEEATEKDGAEREPPSAEVAAREALRAAAAARRPPQRPSRSAEKDRRGGGAHRALGMERRGLEAEIDHLEAAFATCRTWAPTCSRWPARIPARSRSPAAVSCEPGYERALAAALAQVSGALAVPRGVDHWSLLGALKSAGIGLVRLVVLAPAAATAGGLSRRRVARGQGRPGRARASWPRRWPTWSSSTTCAPCPTSSPASP